MEIKLIHERTQNQWFWYFASRDEHVVMPVSFLLAMDMLSMFPFDKSDYYEGSNYHFLKSTK